jgi:lipopolysaccharide biosynthesis regulator YciM
VVILVGLNGSILQTPFNFFGIRIPTAWVMTLALLAGFLSFGLWLAVSGITQVVTRWLRDLRQQNERVAEEHYLKGLDAILGSRPLEAINHFQHALDAQAGYLPALLKLGDALRAAGRPEEALARHREALNEHPDDIPTLYALTEDYLALRDHEETKKHLWEILRLQPKRALKALRILRTLYIQEANWRKALEIQDRIADARVLEEERAEDAPYTPGVLYQIGVDLLAQEKYSDAIAHLEKLRKNHPNFISAYLKLAEAYLRDGREEAAVEVYLDGYRRITSVTCLMAMEQFFMDRGDPESAVRHYQALIATTDRKVIPKFLLGRLYYRLEVLDRAEPLFREIEGSIRQSGLLQYYLGRIRERRGDSAMACGNYREVIKALNPFELNYRCGTCGDLSPSWKAFCSRCQKWDCYVPSFKDELLQEIQEPSPVFYQDLQWTSRAGARSS